MPTFRVDYVRKGLGFLSDDPDPGWQYLPEKLEADGYTIGETWVTFWADESRDPTWAPPPVLRVRAKDTLRIEWLDRPEPTADSLRLRVTYKVMTLFTDDGDQRRHDELLVGTYSVGSDFVHGYHSGEGGWDKRPVFTARGEIVERIERLESGIRPIDRESAART
jgi:hypothetical protein